MLFRFALILKAVNIFETDDHTRAWKLSVNMRGPLFWYKIQFVLTPVTNAGKYFKRISCEFQAVVWDIRIKGEERVEFVMQSRAEQSPPDVVSFA